jgi:CheY-like chemotaxis protein
VLLPVIEPETEPKVEEPEALPTGNEKILFIDDEESIIKVVKRMLERLGYQVETKTNPVEALELFRSEPDRFDLVITDLTMPEIAGEKLIEEILSIHANMPIILCTGYHEKISEEKAGELGVKALVFKPFTPLDFALTIRNVLDKKCNDSS